MQENHLAKWLNNELSEEELIVFRQSEEYKSYQKIVAATDNLKSPDFNVDKALLDFQSRTKATEPKVIAMRPYKKFFKVAAAIALLLAASYFYVNTLGQNITTQFAENKEITLPDNSEIVLNADSNISYDEKNWNQKRNINLDGEAFFKVAKGEKFTVATDNGSVTVLGTQFNVENRAGYFEVSCYEGLVSVIYDGKETKLPAGNSFLAINGKITNLDAIKNGHPSWIDKESTFKSIPLKYVLDEFERQHNITVKTQDINLDQLFTGTFSNTDINLALQSISVPSQLKIKLEGTKVLFYAENMP
ncbi:FecR family protein [Aurantibacter crassamenti]|uniref:FecR family protein n=1 Tax=Aurantibacter crassamenti TaxID=1837375 RepID=UPI00193A052B|nr:FecR family protein [Aurantibacter crassamenti]MBM1106151.1 FecR family protein [Aurantibacter crassamenti]